mgnify:CR=1 FL=1
MWNTTLCYIEREGQYLMLHRVKKENDINKDKWIGIGGKFEDKESPEECLVREVREETGLTLTDYTYRGLVTFVSDRWVTEYMHLFTARTEESVTRGTWSGWTRTRCRTCPSGRGIRSSWTCSPKTSPFSP